MNRKQKVIQSTAKFVKKHPKLINLAVLYLAIYLFFSKLGELIAAKVRGIFSKKATRALAIVVISICTVVLVVAVVNKLYTPLSQREPLGYEDGEEPTDTIVLKGGKMFYGSSKTQPLWDFADGPCAGISYNGDGDVPIYTFEGVYFVSQNPIAMEIDEDAIIESKRMNVVASTYDAETAGKEKHSYGIYSEHDITITGEGVFRMVSGDVTDESVDSIGVKAASITIDGDDDSIVYALSGNGNAGSGYGVYADNLNVREGQLICGGDSAVEDGGFGIYVKNKFEVLYGIVLTYGTDIAVEAGELDISPNVYAMKYDNQYLGYYEVQAETMERDEGRLTYRMEDNEEPSGYIHITTDAMTTRDKMITWAQENAE